MVVRVKMKLVSDFRQIYDCWFLGDNLTFHRMMRMGPSKREQFSLLKSAGYRIPNVGTANELLNKGILSAIVYTDEDAHCGEGKYYTDKLVNNDYFCSEFIGDPNVRPSISVRRLQVGRMVSWLKYISNDHIFSNCGDGDISILVEPTLCYYHPYFSYPMFAIDFVADCFGQKYAIDLNISPGIPSNLMPGQDIVKELQLAYDNGVWEGK